MLLRGTQKIRDLVGLLETINFLSVRLFFSNPRQYRRFPGMIFRDWVHLNNGAKWRCDCIFDVLQHLGGTHGRITLEHLPGGGIDASLDELAYLALITKSLAPHVIFEFGTFRGRTALNFALNSPEDTKVLTLDLPQGPDRSTAMEDAWASDAEIIRRSFTGADYAGKDVTHKIHQLFGDSLTFDFSPYVDQVDLVFVDGGHRYEVVSSDTVNALRLVRPGGVIVWHDFAEYGHYNDVTRAILDALPADELIQIENSQLALYQRPPSRTGLAERRRKPQLISTHSSQTN